MEQRSNQLDELKQKIIALENLVNNNANHNKYKNLRNNKALDKRDYCWTHGFTQNRYYTSASCYERARGHKDTATADNKMWGCTDIMKKYVA